MRNISRILAFRIDGEAELPATPDRTVVAPLSDDFGTDTQVAEGASLYTRYCSVCHGVFAISGGVMPDLRHSAMPATAESFRSVVLEGTLQDGGMASFSQVLSAADAESIRAYVVRQANQ
jgi:alcohol dehydrogenase (cytochrome c)/quinohemoprotein ethanol dehydrogenase